LYLLFALISAPLGMILRSDGVGLRFFRARADEYSYILIDACFVFAQLVSSQQCG
jgi:hypothetical protein